MPEIYNFDDFFVSPDDLGAEATLTINGRDVPIMLKRNLTLQDIEECKAAAIQTRINAQGQPELVSVDENEFSMQVLLRVLKSWPFTYSDGSPVPINRASIENMMATGASALMQLVLTIIQGRDITPFVPPSAGA
jgi:hypothetical protein